MSTATAKRSLFQIGADFEALESLLAELDGDISDPQAAAAIEAWFAEVEQNLAEKADAYIWLIRKWESEKAVAKAEQDRMKKFSQVRENRVVTLKQRMFDWMEQRGRNEIATHWGNKIRIQKNGGKRAMEVNEAQVGEAIAASVATIAPDAPQLVRLPAGVLDLIRPYLKAEIQLDTDKVRADLEAGKTLPFAELLPQGRSLRIA